MINSKINIKCSDCGKELTINIKTINTLQNEIKVLKERLKYYEIKRNAENICSGKENEAFNMFSKMFGDGE